jgi:hypothetical protein
MTNPSMSKKDKSIARIIATKFHTNPETELESEVKLNPIMRDLIINRHVEKHYKQEEMGNLRKRQKIGVKSIGENQPVWLNTLKEETSRLE